MANADDRYYVSIDPISYHIGWHNRELIAPLTKSTASLRKPPKRVSVSVMMRDAIRCAAAGLN